MGTEDTTDQDSVQDGIAAFLCDGGGHRAGGSAVEIIETHGAVVFVTADDVYKIKRAVRFPYMDFSTLELRHRALAREFEINQPHAPGLYLGLVAVTRTSAGRLALGGSGEVVEWALHMRRFSQDALLSNIAAAHDIESGLARDIADAVFDYHSTSPVVTSGNAEQRIGVVIDEIGAALAASARLADPAAIPAFTANCRIRLVTAQDLLLRREMQGFVRRGHGDLHLNNIVLWRGQPTLFDALEFDEALATIDTLYDLAFLLMDLDHQQARKAANLVLNRYLWRSQALADIEGLALLPLFLALRAGIRAMVAAERTALLTDRAASASSSEMSSYFEQAVAYLAPPAPRLIAVGGVSGTGKSTLAAELAPTIGAAPGAVHLRSDLERKAMFGVAQTDRLPEASYTREVTDRVYAQLLAKATAAISAGHAVIVDAAHLLEAEKRAIETLATHLHVPFSGLWLTAPDALLKDRIVRRRGDASDATPDVLERQLSWGPSSHGWTVIDASGPATAALTAAEGVMARS